LGQTILEYCDGSGRTKLQ